MQGGTSGEYYHLTAAEYAALGASPQYAQNIYTGATSATIDSVTFKPLNDLGGGGPTSIVATSEFVNNSDGSITYIGSSNATLKIHVYLTA